MNKDDDEYPHDLMIYDSLFKIIWLFDLCDVIKMFT